MLAKPMVFLWTPELREVVARIRALKKGQGDRQRVPVRNARGSAPTIRIEVDRTDSIRSGSDIWPSRKTRRGSKVERSSILPSTIFARRMRRTKPTRRRLGSAWGTRRSRRPRHTAERFRRSNPHTAKMPNKPIGYLASLVTTTAEMQCGGSPTWARTRDLRINSPSLYRLSYRGIVRLKAQNSNVSVACGQRTKR